MSKKKILTKTSDKRDIHGDLEDTLQNFDDQFMLFTDLIPKNKQELFNIIHVSRKYYSVLYHKYTRIDEGNKKRKEIKGKIIEILNKLQPLYDEHYEIFKEMNDAKIKYIKIIKNELETFMTNEGQLKSKEIQSAEKLIHHLYKGKSEDQEGLKEIELLTDCIKNNINDIIYGLKLNAIKAYLSVSKEEKNDLLEEYSTIKKSKVHSITSKKFLSTFLDIAKKDFVDEHLSELFGYKANSTENEKYFQNNSIGGVIYFVSNFLAEISEPVYINNRITTKYKPYYHEFLEDTRLDIEEKTVNATSKAVSTKTSTNKTKNISNEKQSYIPKNVLLLRDTIYTSLAIDDEDKKEVFGYIKRVYKKQEKLDIYWISNLYGNTQLLQKDLKEIILEKAKKAGFNIQEDTKQSKDDPILQKKITNNKESDTKQEHQQKRNERVDLSNGAELIDFFISYGYKISNRNLFLDQYKELLQKGKYYHNDLKKIPRIVKDPDFYRHRRGPKGEYGRIFFESGLRIVKKGNTIENILNHNQYKRIYTVVWNKKQ